ncbi:MAG: hypothetical protein MST02_11495 [Enterocloster clostridioformis]|nr:hypothetical protein [Enterocloster clostridioformis]MCI7609680.1 hypothetical protein [Enterocloster clostridioformis]MDY4530823.1 hypothetical protein [Enterocloster aldenensis]
MKMIRRKGKIGVRRVIRLFDIERYQKKLDSMRKNRKNVLLEELTTRYAKPYAQLKQELNEMTRQFLHETVLPGIRILPEDLEAFAEELNRVIEDSGILEKIIWLYDYDQVLDAALDLKYIVMNRYYQLIEGDGRYD